MPQRLTNPRAQRISFVNRAAVRDPARPTEPRRFVLFKAEGGPIPNEGDEVSTIDKSELDPAVRELVEKAEQERAEAVERAEKAEREAAELRKAGVADDDDEEDEEGKKGKKAPPKLSKSEYEGLPEPVRIALEKAEEDRAADRERIRKAEERAENAESLAKQEGTRREQATFVQKADTGDLRAIPGDPAEIGLALHALAKADPDAYRVLEEKVLTPASAQLAASDLFKEQGRGGEGPPPESAIAKMESAVETIQKADPSISRFKAMEQARLNNPQLAAQMNAELRGVPLADRAGWTGHGR